MKIFRSIAGIVVGCIVAGVLVFVFEAINGVIYPPPAGMSGSEWMKAVHEGAPVAKEWIQSLPETALVLVQIGWAVGAFVGGAVGAWVAGRARLFHAGFAGAFILFATILNFYMMKEKLEYTHPDWLIATGLLLPLPLSLLGGMFVNMLSPIPATPTESAPPVLPGE